MEEASVLIGPRVHVRNEKPHPVYFEITFLPDSSLDLQKMEFAGLTLRNYFCSHLIIKQLQTSSDADPADISTGTSGSHSAEQQRWVTVAHQQLMKDPHCETDAQDWHAIYVDEFNERFRPGPAPRPPGGEGSGGARGGAVERPLRVYLRGISPLWQTADVQEVRCYRRPYQKTAAGTDRDYTQQTEAKDDNTKKNNNAVLESLQISFGIIKRSSSNKTAIDEAVR